MRIRPQKRRDEPVADLIEDPWLTLPCPADGAGCAVEFEDVEYEAAARDAIYYVRAIEEPTPSVHGAGVGCEYDESGRCVRVTTCGREREGDDCLADVEQRAWSSPIFADWNGG